MVGEGARAGVGEDDRRRGGVQGVVHGLRRDVGEVDQHPEAVHLAHHVAAEIGEAAVLRLVGGRVGPRRVEGMGEREVARAEPVELAQHGERTGDRMPALDPDQAGDAPGLVDALDVGGGIGHLEVARVAADHAVDEVDLLERVRQPARGGPLGFDVHRPELRPDAALPQARQVGVERGLEVAQVAGQVEALEREPALAVLPRQVVVAVDERHPAQDLPGAGEVGIVAVHVGGRLLCGARRALGSGVAAGQRRGAERGRPPARGARSHAPRTLAFR